ncbi:MAG TPA: PDZ domain-containing protein [Bacteroidetes bacterium]|nr:PDZ domain-containing protein [Bacteroidota bacterium]
MKQIFSLTLASIFGGMLTLGGYFLFVENQNDALPVAPNYAKKVSNVNVSGSAGFNVPFDFAEAAEKATPAVVHISAKSNGNTASNGSNQQGGNPFLRFFGDGSFGDSPFFNFDGPKEGTGSGVIYSSDGYIVTNNHVVEFADEIEVATVDKKTYKAKVVGTYPEGDLAVLKIEAHNLPTLRLANSDEAKIGEWVLAVGNPMELNSTVTAGIISAKGRDINIIKKNSAIESFIQTDAAVNPGNSGGALVDAYGRLLGINTAIATSSGFYQGYSFAIPVNLVAKIVDDIIENGSYDRGFLGINIADLDEEDVQTLGLEDAQGILVAGVVDGGAAQYAGVVQDDVIIEVDNKKVKSSPELLEAIGGLKAGDLVTLTVDRKGEILTIPVRLKAAGQ